MKKILTIALASIAALSIGLAEDEKGKGKGKGKGDPAARAAAMFKKLDADGSGAVSKEEFLASPMAQRMTEGGKDPAELFGKKDKDESGDLSAAELAPKPRGKGDKGKGKGKGKGDAE